MNKEFNTFYNNLYKKYGSRLPTKLSNTEKLMQFVAKEAWRACWEMKEHEKQDQKKPTFQSQH